MAAVLAATGVAAAQPGQAPFTFAVIGDIPYGAAAVAAFPAAVDAINADPAVNWVIHLGDIKNGSSVCSDTYFAGIRAQFDRFADPLVYTPGDNEWTDCHRANNGSYNPLERLAAVRALFFPNPGRTLGGVAGVQSQADRGLPENVSYTRAGVRFAALHLVGSNNSLQPWTGLGYTAATPEQVAEEESRTAGALDLIRSTFDNATSEGAPAVVFMLQADMFDPGAATPGDTDFSAFKPVVQALAAGAATYGKPVYLFNGDSHVFTSDNPLGAGSRWLSYYGVPAVPNLKRLTVDGSSNATDYLRVTVRPGSADLLTVEKVPFVPS